MKRKRVDLIVTDVAQLLTLKGPKRARRGDEMMDLGIIEDCAVAVKGSDIVACAPTAGIEKRYEGKELISASRKVVMPGFVDPHTHLIFAGSREKELAYKLQGLSYLEILERGGGILSTVNATRKATLTTLVALGLDRLDRMLAYGTTTVEAKTGYGLSLKDELKCLEAMRVIQEKHLVDIVPTFLGTAHGPSRAQER